MTYKVKMYRTIAEFEKGLNDMYSENFEYIDFERDSNGHITAVFKQ